MRGHYADMVEQDRRGLTVNALHADLIAQDADLLGLGVWANVDARAVAGSAGPSPGGLDV